MDILKIIVSYACSPRQPDWSNRLCGWLNLPRKYPGKLWYLKGLNLHSRKAVFKFFETPKTNELCEYQIKVAIEDDDMDMFKKIPDPLNWNAILILALRYPRFLKEIPVEVLTESLDYVIYQIHKEEHYRLLADLVHYRTLLPGAAYNGLKITREFVRTDGDREVAFLEACDGGCMDTAKEFKPKVLTYLIPKMMQILNRTAIYFLGKEKLSTRQALTCFRYCKRIGIDTSPFETREVIIHFRRDQF
jgi:hypothetical protein